jgi:hypothetical protein
MQILSNIVPKFEIEIIVQLLYQNSKQMLRYIEKNLIYDFGRTMAKIQQDLLGQVSRLQKREGQKYVNFYGKS